MINSVELITEFVSPPIGVALMRNNVWLAFAVSIPIILLSYSIIAAIPGTLASAAQPIDARPSSASGNSYSKRQTFTKVGLSKHVRIRVKERTFKVLHRFSGYFTELF